MKSNSIPEFHPSPETELLCRGVMRDTHGQVLAHILRSVDVARQQNSFIIGEQMTATSERKQIITSVEVFSKQLQAHEEQDAIHFGALRVAQKELNDWRRMWFGRKGVGALVLSALLFVGYDAVLKPFIAKQTKQPQAPAPAVPTSK